MKLFRKERLSNGRRHVYFCGIKVISYRKKNEKNIPNIVGNGNIVINPDNLPVKIDISGNNNKIIIDSSEHKETYFLNIHVGFKGAPCNNCVIHIGKNCSFSQTEIFVWDNDLQIDIGQECMFS